MSDNTSAHDHLQELLWGFAAHRILTVSARVGLLDALATKEGLTPEKLAKQCGLTPMPTGKIVRALVAMGIAVSDHGRYRLTHAMASITTAKQMPKYIQLCHGRFMPPAPEPQTCIPCL